MSEENISGSNLWRSQVSPVLPGPATPGVEWRQNSLVEFLSKYSAESSEQPNKPYSTLSVSERLVWKYEKLAGLERGRAGTPSTKTDPPPALAGSAGASGR